LLATRPTSPQQVVVTEFGKRHDTTDTTDFSRTSLLQPSYGLLVYVADLLWTCYGETGVTDFDLYPFPYLNPSLIKGDILKMAALHHLGFCCEQKSENETVARDYWCFCKF